MNHFQNPNFVLMLQEIVQTVWCEKLNILGFLFEILPPEVAQFFVSYYCKSN